MISLYLAFTKFTSYLNVYRALTIIVLTALLPLAMSATPNRSIADQSVVQGKVQQGFDAIYHFDFDRAEQIIEELYDTHPNSPWSAFLKVNYHWWQIISGNNTDEHQEGFEAAAEMGMNLLPKKRADSLSDDELFLLINIHACKSRMLAFNEKRIKALMSLSTAMSFLKRSFGREPLYDAFYLSSGLYNFYIINGAKKHPYLAPYLILFPRGDEEKGFPYIHKAAASDNQIVNTEALYFLMKLWMDHEEQPAKAEAYAIDLANRYKPNLMFRYYHFKTLIQQYRMEEAKEVLLELTKQSKQNQTLTQSQRDHFTDMAREDLKEYYRTKTQR